MTMPGRTFNSGDYRYGFNGMEKDDEIKGDNNSLDFGARIYDPRVGRWLSLDPLAAKNPGITPYHFTKNNPILYVDPDGEDNVIYLVYLPSENSSISKEDAETIKSKANENFKKLGLKTQVVLVDMSKKDNSYFDPCAIDNTDAIAVIGTKDDVTNYVTNSDQKFGNELRDEWSGGELNPEKSENNRENPIYYGGEWIAIDANGLSGFGEKILGGSSAVETGAFAINHGAGHNSQLNHHGENLMPREYGDESPTQSSPIMFSGNQLRDYFNFNQYPGYNDGDNPALSDLTHNNDGRNDGYVKAAKERFGNNDPKPTYTPK